MGQKTISGERCLVGRDINEGLTRVFVWFAEHDHRNMIQSNVLGAGFGLWNGQSVGI